MISWNYSKVAPDYGQGQMKELNSLLKDLFQNFDISITSHKGALEVKSKAEPKTLITEIMKKRAKIYPIDFMLAFGDDERYANVFQFLDNRRNYSLY